VTPTGLAGEITPVAKGCRCARPRKAPGNIKGLPPGDATAKSVTGNSIELAVRR
jgi:hypothetical protein